jgi:hypothetical protein
LYDGASVAAKSSHFEDLSGVRVSDLRIANCTQSPWAGKYGDARSGTTVFATGLGMQVEEHEHAGNAEADPSHQAA